MDDLISRQAAIDAVFAWYEDYKTNGINVKKPLVDWLKNLPSAQPERKKGWIPCSEKLPEVRQWVLCQCRAGIMDVLRLTADGSWSKNYPRTKYMSCFVVAWMPLPEPYQINIEEKTDA